MISCRLRRILTLLSTRTPPIRYGRQQGNVSTQVHLGLRHGLPSVSGHGGNQGWGWYMWLERDTDSFNCTFESDYTSCTKKQMLRLPQLRPQHHQAFGHLHLWHFETQHCGYSESWCGQKSRQWSPLALVLMLFQRACKQPIAPCMFTHVRVGSLYSDASEIIWCRLSLLVWKGLNPVLLR